MKKLIFLTIFGLLPFISISQVQQIIGENLVLVEKLNSISVNGEFAKIKFISGFGEFGESKCIDCHNSEKILVNRNNNLN